MKKIGILTFYNAHNYGAMLQAIALQDFLKNRNYDAYIINYRNPNIDNRYRLTYWNEKNVKQLIRNIIKTIIFSRKFNKRYDAFEDFLNNNFVLTEKYLTEEELKRKAPDFDVYITGSDQVWNYDITGDLEDSYTLNFGTEKVNRISYAASIGNDEIKKEYEEIYRRKLRILDHISVREESAKNKLEKILGRNIYETVDPTLLVDYEYWNEKVKLFPKEKEKYILAYQVEPNEEYTKIVNYLSEKTGYKVIHFEKTNKNYNNVLHSAFTANPIEFVNLVKNAEYIVNTSFHGTVFSTIFHKKFFVIPHTETGSRMTDLMKKTGLEKRIVYKFDQFKNINFEDEIDYNRVDKIIAKERQKSVDFLINSLKMDKGEKNENINNNSNI